MDMKTKIQIAKLTTTLGWLEEDNWKTPRILFEGYRSTGQQKAVNNAAKAGYTFIQELLNIKR